MKLLSSIPLFLAAGYSCAFSVRPTSVFIKSIDLTKDLSALGAPRPCGFHSRSCRQLARQTNESGETSKLSTPLDRPVLALVDVVSLLTFAAVGKASHTPDGAIDPIATATVAFPFLLSWFVTAPFTGVYAEDEREGNLVLETFLKSGKGWIVAIPLGCVIRGIIKGYVPPAPFVIVTVIATFVILGLGRLLFAVLEDFFVELAN
jgi:hypothetical protein